MRMKSVPTALRISGSSPAHQAVVVAEDDPGGPQLLGGDSVRYAQRTLEEEGQSGSVYVLLQVLPRGQSMREARADGILIVLGIGGLHIYADAQCAMRLRKADAWLAGKQLRNCCKIEWQ